MVITRDWEKAGEGELPINEHKVPIKQRGDVPESSKE